MDLVLDARPLANSSLASPSRVLMSTVAAAGGGVVAGRRGAPLRTLIPVGIERQTEADGCGTRRLLLHYLARIHV